MEQIKREMETLSLKEQEYKKEISHIKREISEAKDVLIRLNKSIQKFENSVSAKRNINSSVTYNTKVFKTYISKLNLMLSGNSYKKARGNFDEIVFNINCNIRKLNQDMEYVKEQLTNIQRNKNELQQRYNQLMSEMES